MSTPREPRSGAEGARRHLTRRRFLGAAAAGGVAAGGVAAAASLTRRAPAFLQEAKPNEKLHVAVIGTGRRGKDHLWSMGFHDPEIITGPRKKLELEPLEDVRVVAVCDTFDRNREEAVRHVEHVQGEGGCRGYVDYRELLEKEELDGVVIATPDHMHTPIAIAAIEAGCDVYVEKCMSNDLEQTFALGDALERHGRLLQCGFQHHQDHIFQQAGNVIRDGHIGQVKMVQTFLHRGGEAGAWIFPEEKNGGPPRDQLHWDAFLGGVAPEVPYTPKRYFGWRCFWDYSTGISGDIFTHILNAANGLVGLGIPSSVVATGGVFYWQDGRETPDTFSVLCNYEEEQLTLSFQCTLCNSFPDQATRIMGTDGTVELDWRLRVYPDRWSNRYADQFRAGTKNPNEPFIDIKDSAAGLVVNAAPSLLWLGGRGATLTTREDGKVRDTTRLHHENFWSCVRSRQQPDASYADSLPVTVAAHMATISYREKCHVSWDAEERRVVRS